LLYVFFQMVKFPILVLQRPVTPTDQKREEKTRRTKSFYLILEFVHQTIVSRLKFLSRGIGTQVLPFAFEPLNLDEMQREPLKNATRIVVKFGTGVLTDSRKQPDLFQMEQLVAQIAVQRQAGREIVIVTSGAVGSGMGALGYEARPAGLAERQACAAVGQTRLMATYEKLFHKFGLIVGQVLLTHEDLEHHERHLNARNTLVTLLDRGVVPIINENDAVSITELKFGDNDKLSALVAALLPADLLVILTTVDGVFENFGKTGAKLLSVVEQIDATLEDMAGGTNSATAVGGMKSKIEAAKIVVRSGVPLVIASGLKKNALLRITAGEDEGTFFVAQPVKLQGRKRWIAFYHHPKGALFVDDGAKVALRENGKSLLPPGVTRCEGEFVSGEVVRICDLDGMEFARGIARFDSAIVRAGNLPKEELVHRDDLVIL
jgi:glutamate 5-kinase